MISLLLAVVLLAPQAAAADPAYRISFDGSVTYLSTGETGKIIVTVGQSPGGSYNYTVSADQGSVTPTSGTTSASSFNVTASAPTTKEDMVVSVTLSNGHVSTTAKYTIHVVDPVVISATVKNSGQVSLTGVPVQFFVDNNLVNATTFNIGANTTQTVSYQWTTNDLSNGEHSIKVVIDPNNQYQFLSLVGAGNSHEYSSKFYVGDAGWGLANIALALAFVLLLVIGFLTYRSRKTKKKK